jgi:hypothetical protein
MALGSKDSTVILPLIFSHRDLAQNDVQDIPLRHTAQQLLIAHECSKGSGPFVINNAMT